MMRQNHDTKVQLTVKFQSALHKKRHMALNKV